MALTRLVLLTALFSTANAVSLGAYGKVFLLAYNFISIQNGTSGHDR